MLEQGATHITIAGTIFYVAAEAGVVVLDMDDPLHPKQVTTLPFDGARATAVQFRYLFVTDNTGLHVVNVTDPSAPPFYVPGQSESGNVRAFAALNPCLADGQACASGLDCCCGFCLVEEGSGQAEGVCSCEVPECAKTNEKCETDADCCPPEGDDPPNSCLGGFCGFILVE